MKSPGRKYASFLLLGLAMAGALGIGCWQAPSPHTISRDYGYREVPVDAPGCGQSDRFEDTVNGGQLFKMYCGSCHNARALGERPFANYEVAIAHMREQANLTGKEYRKIIHFLRRWDEVGPPTPDVEPSPKRFYFSQPINELRKQAPDKPDKGAAPD